MDFYPWAGRVLINVENRDDQLELYQKVKKEISVYVKPKL